MRISPISSAHSRQAELTELMRLHAGLWDRDDAASAAARSPLESAGSDKPRSVALLRPNYRPFWASRLAPRLGPVRSRTDLARINHGGEAELPLWSRMTVHDHLHLEAIPGNHPMELEIRPERVHRRRLLSEISPVDEAVPGVPPRHRASGASGDKGVKVRQAVLGRHRFLATCGAGIAPAPLFS